MASPVDNLHQTPQDSEGNQPGAGGWLTPEELARMHEGISGFLAQSATSEAGVEAPEAVLGDGTTATTADAKTGTEADEAAADTESTDTGAEDDDADEDAPFVPPKSPGPEATAGDSRPNHKKRNIITAAAAAAVAAAVTLVVTLSGHGNDKATGETSPTSDQKPTPTANSNRPSTSTQEIAPGQTSVSIEKSSSADTSAATSQEEPTKPSQSSKPTTSGANGGESQPHHKNPNKLGNTWYDPNGPVELSADEYKDTQSLVDATIKNIAAWCSGGTDIKDDDTLWNVVIGYKGAPWTNGVVKAMKPNEAADAFAAYNAKLYATKMFAPDSVSDPGVKTLIAELTREDSAAIEGYALTANNSNTGDYSVQVDSSDRNPDDKPFFQAFTTKLSSITKTDEPNEKKASFVVQRIGNERGTSLGTVYGVKENSKVVLSLDMTWKIYENSSGKKIWLISDATLAPAGS